MSYKSRGNWLGTCLRNCVNRGNKCKLCLVFSEYVDTLNPPKKFTKEKVKEYKQKETDDPYLEGERDHKRKDGFK